MKSRPNMLFIMSDQHSKFHLGCYGDPLVRTPHLDRLASEGMTFTNAYTAAPLCVPARMAFMTGRRPSANQVWTNDHILSSALPTWAHAIGALGYETALIGRMHFVGADQRHGFEYRPLGEYGANYPGAPKKGGPILKSIPGTLGQTRECVETAGYGRTTNQDFDDRVARAVCAYLEEKAGKNERPFAAVAGFVLPHCPFFAPRELYEYYSERVDVPQPSAREREREPPAITNFKKRRRLHQPLPVERIKVARAAYFGLCEYFDRKVGQILDVLDETGLSESTLVIYCSDHGEMAGEHGCWWKSNYYEGSVGVPLIARLPGVVPADGQNPVLCNLLDLAPTAVEMAGGAALPAADGYSLWKELRGERDGDRDDSTFSELSTSHGDPPSRMVRQGPWKLYKCHDGTPPALFNLAEDPEELNDLGTDPVHAPVRRNLLDRLYANWDPERVTHRSAELARDMQLLTAWGRTVQPAHPAALPVEDVENVVRC